MVNVQVFSQVVSVFNIVGYYQETGGTDILSKKLIERFSTAWRCTVCKKMCSSQKMARQHLEDVHHVTKQQSFY